MKQRFTSNDCMSKIGCDDHTPNVRTYNITYTKTTKMNEPMRFVLTWWVIIFMSCWALIFGLFHLFSFLLPQTELQDN